MTRENILQCNVISLLSSERRCLKISSLIGEKLYLSDIFFYTSTIHYLFDIFPDESRFQLLSNRTQKRSESVKDRINRSSARDNEGTGYHVTK